MAIFRSDTELSLMKHVKEKQKQKQLISRIDTQQAITRIAYDKYKSELITFSEYQQEKTKLDILISHLANN